jgi:hypothetical protein
VQLTGDLRRGPALGDEHQDLLLAGAELRPVVSAPQADLLCDAGLGGAVEDRLAARHRGDRAPDRGRLGVLGEIAGGALSDRVVGLDRQDLGGEKQQPGGAGLPFDRQRLEHLRVDDGHVRGQAPDRRGELVRVLRLGDQFQLAVLPDRSCQCVAEQRLGVRRDHANRAERRRGAWGRHPCEQMSM